MYVVIKQYHMALSPQLCYPITKKMVGCPMDWGFEMSPYKLCCSNKMINKEQFVIVFHVNDLKLSHKDEE